MPEVARLSVPTFCVTAVLTLLCRCCVNASQNENDYELFSERGFRNNDELSDNMLQLLLFPTMLEQRDAIEDNQNGVINPFLSSDYLNKETLYPLMDDEQYIIETPDSRDQILSQNDFKADDIDKYAKPSLSKLLKVIDQLKLPGYRHVPTSDEKRSWNGNPAFGTLVSAVGRLGRLNDGESKTESRRFHSWGG